MRQVCQPWHVLLGAVVVLLLAGESFADILYVSLPSAGTIDEVAPGGSVSTFVSGLSSPSGLAYGSGGSLFVATAQGSYAAIQIVSPLAKVTPFVSGIIADYLNGLAFDQRGNLFIGLDDYGIDKVTPNAAVSTFASALGQNVAFDSAGDLISAATVDNEIFETFAGGIFANESFVSSFNSPLGLAFDSSGDLFVSSEKLGTITEFSNSGPSKVYASLSASNSPFPSGSTTTLYGLAFDSSGNLYVAEGDGTTGAIGLVTNGTIQTYATLPAVPAFIADPSVTLALPEPGGFAALCAGAILLALRPARVKVLN